MATSNNKMSIDTIATIADNHIKNCGLITTATTATSNEQRATSNDTMKGSATMTTSNQQPQRKIGLADTAIYHINYAHVEYATQPTTIKHKHCYNMVALNKYAKNNATIATALQQYRDCTQPLHSFDFVDLVLEITATIAYEIVASIDVSDHLQLLKYTSMVADMYNNNEIDYKSKQHCFYYNLYSRMYNLLLIMVNDNPQLYSTIIAQAGIIATSNRNDDTATINDLKLPITIYTASDQYNGNDDDDDDNNEQRATATVAADNEQRDDDDDDEIIHLYFNALCMCDDCTSNRDGNNEQHNNDTTTATVAVADDYNVPATTATNNDNVKGSATMTTRNEQPRYHVMSSILELQPTTQPATATVINSQKQVFQYIYSNNGNEQQPLTSIYEYDKTQPFMTKNTTTKYFPSNKKWITTTATVAVAADYNTPTTATTTATATVAEYYEKYKINTATRRQQRATRNAQQRQQRARLQYKNMSVADVYEKMTATRRIEKLNNAIEYDYKIALSDYYNDGNNGND